MTIPAANDRNRNNLMVNIGSPRRVYRYSQNTNPTSSTNPAGRSVQRTHPGHCSPCVSHTKPSPTINRTAPVTSILGRATRSATGNNRQPRNATTIPTGTLTRKDHRQPHSAPPRATSPPPSTGPDTRATLTPAMTAPNGSPRSRAEYSRCIVPKTCANASPTPTPCTSRAPISHAPCEAKAATPLATTNAVTPVTKMARRPRTSPNRPAGTNTRPNAR